MLKRIIEQYVAPLAAAAAGGAGGAGGAAGGAAGAAGASGASTAGEGKAVADMAKSGGGGSIPNPGDVIGGGIRSAGRAAAAPFNILSAIPQSAGASYRADTGEKYSGHNSGRERARSIMSMLSDAANMSRNAAVEQRGDPDFKDFHPGDVAMAKMAEDHYEEWGHTLSPEDDARARKMIEGLHNTYGGLHNFDGRGRRVEHYTSVGHRYRALLDRLK